MQKLHGFLCLFENAFLRFYTDCEQFSFLRPASHRANDGDALDISSPYREQTQSAKNSHLSAKAEGD